jgi:predicted DNA-binding transcriptional regulator YafY
MARSDRLFRLLHALRMLPPPVTATRLAAETGVSERTLYRDIESLRIAGALIDGEPGYGYRLTEDLAMPPQQFTRIELEALLLGLSQVRRVGDAELGEAAEAAMAKIVGSLPERLQRQALHSVLQVYRFDEPPEPAIDLSLLRKACWDEQAMSIVYADAEGRQTERGIWPLSIVYLEHTLVVLAWCCLRQDFRKFRVDRIMAIRPLQESFRPRRVPLLREFIAQLQGN